MKQPLAWKNGKVLPFAELSLHVSDLGVVAGASITEMARTFAHKTFRLKEHIQRLMESCHELGFPMQHEAAELVSAAEQIVHENCRLIPSSSDLGIVAFATAGTNRTYVGTGQLPEPTVAIHTFTLPFELWKSQAADGVSLSVPRRTQIDGSALPVHRKVRNRLHWWLADREAESAKPGSKALLLDLKGRVTETSNGCFYAVFDNEIVTPKNNVLNSMSRRIVEEAANENGLAFSVRDFSVDDLTQASECFVSSTPFGVFFVRSIDDQVFENRHPVATLLNEFWQRLSGVNPMQQILSCSKDSLG